jgi:PAS domain S-box-containing protein
MQVSKDKTFPFERYTTIAGTADSKEKVRNYAALTIPVFLAVILFTHFIISEEFRRSHVFEPRYLLPILNFIFLGLSSLLVCILAAKSYLKTGRLNLALLGSGALACGLAGITAGWFIHLPGGVNITVTIFNCGMLLSGLLHFSCSVAGIMEFAPERSLSRKKIILFSIYFTILIVFSLILIAIRVGWMPTFFVQGIGPTMIRQFVLVASILLLLMSGIYLYSLYYKNRVDFLYWYALGLILIAEGLLGIMLSKNVGGIIGWAGRLAQFTGGIFLLVAVYNVLKERSLYDVLAGVFNRPKELYTSMFENSLDGIIIAVHDGPVLNANLSACTLLRFDHIQLGRLAIEDLFDPEHSAYQIFRNELAAEGKARTELVLIDKEGARIPVTASSVVFEDGFGEKLEVLTFKDISERLRTEEALLRSEQHLRDVLDNMVALIGVLTPDGALIEANRTALEVADLKIEDVRGKLFEECYWWSWSEEVQQRLREAIRKAAAGQVIRYDETIRVGEGKFRIIDFMLSATMENGHVKYLIPSATDITERKLAEEELQTTAEFLHLMNESKDTEELIKKTIDFISEKTGIEAVGIRLKKGYDYPYYETRGLPKKFVLMENSLCSLDKEGKICLDSNGNPVLECMCGNVICGCFDPSKPFFTANGTFWTNSTTELLSHTTEADRQARTRNRCHGEGYESVALIPLRSGGEQLGLIQLNDKRKACFNIEKITLWEQLADYLSVTLSKFGAQEVVRQMNVKLEQQVAERTALAEARAKQLQSLAVELLETEERERRQFAHLLHDDLQQMLAAAKMQLQTVSDSFLNEPAISNVNNIIEKSIEKARRLSHELSPPILNHSGLIPALQWLVQRMASNFDLEVEFETHVEQNQDYAPLKTFIFRAVQELLFNIVKHAGVNRAQMVLSGTDSYLSITVSDSGHGFKPDILDKSKAGFGLMSIRERANYIGGDLTIGSTPGRGSRLTLTIPLIVSIGYVKQQQIPAVSSKIETSEVPVVFASDVTRVLFADDHHVMRQGLIKLVSGQPNIQVVGEAANGQEALDQAHHLRPDVVVMDVSMPEMDGLEATRRIKAELPEIRVIGLSMFDDAHISQTMREAGAEAFVSKTASSVELLNAIVGNKSARS